MLYLNKTTRNWKVTVRERRSTKDKKSILLWLATTVDVWIYFQQSSYSYIGCVLSLLYCHLRDWDVWHSWVRTYSKPKCHTALWFGSALNWTSSSLACAKPCQQFGRVFWLREQCCQLAGPSLLKISHYGCDLATCGFTPAGALSNWIIVRL